MSMDTRPDWDHYFMEIARVVSKRSTCLRRSVGAVIVKNRQIVATGYNGTPSGLEHCAVTGCLREQLKVPSGKMHELCRGIHAEQNAVVQAAFHGVSVNGGTLYKPTLVKSIKSYSSTPVLNALFTPIPIPISWRKKC